jgi:osmoprotectant transport system ATP-binding protein
MIEFKGVTKRYGEAVIVDDVSFAIGRGEFCVLIGASGSGKSTTLRMINRLIEPSSGTILFDGADAASVPPEALRRRIGYAIQSAGLFPHWSVARNIATVPVLLGWPKARIAARTEELLALLSLPPEIAARRPHELSGGQQQRVGLARALAADPEALLMDEPFGALDPVTRASLQTEIRRIQRATGKTVVFVTHDMDEALLLADRIAVMHDGRIAQFAPPAEIIGRPADAYVRDFVGERDAGLKMLSVETVGGRARPGAADGPSVPRGMTLRDALSLMIERGITRLPVEGGLALDIADLPRRG